jgi:hypothetical protein
MIGGTTFACRSKPEMISIADGSDDVRDERADESDDDVRRMMPHCSCNPGGVVAVVVNVASSPCDALSITTH